MGAENSIWFGRDRKVRMPERVYDDHHIGDRCPLPNVVKEMIKEDWKKLKYRKLIKRKLKNLKEFIKKGGNQAESMADFLPDTIFNPNDYPSGTVLRLGFDSDKYTTIRFEHPEKVISLKRLGRPHPEAESYNDGAFFKGNLFGIVLRLPDSQMNIVLRVWALERAILSKKRVKVILEENPITVGAWKHEVLLSPIFRIDFEYAYLHPKDELVVPIDERFIIPGGSQQDDIFYRYAKIQVLAIGKGVQERTHKLIKYPKMLFRRATS